MSRKATVSEEFKEAFRRPGDMREIITQIIDKIIAEDKPSIKGNYNNTPKGTRVTYECEQLVDNMLIEC